MHRIRKREQTHKVVTKLEGKYVLIEVGDPPVALHVIGERSRWRLVSCCSASVVLTLIYAFFAIV